MWSTRPGQARLVHGEATGTDDARGVVESSQSGPDPEPHVRSGQVHRAAQPRWGESERKRLEAGQAPSSRAAFTLPERAITIGPEVVDRNLVSFHDSATHVTEQYDKLAVGLVMAADEAPLKRVLIASPERGDGRTSVTLNLACALASVGQRVLVVDCDLRSPSALRLLGVETQVGLAEVLAGTVSLNAATVSILPYGFDVLPGREGVESSTKALAQPVFREILSSFDQIYDFVLFDSPPLLEATGSHLLAQVVHTTLLVVRAGKTSSAELSKAIAPFGREDLFGVVLNRVD